MGILLMAVKKLFIVLLTVAIVIAELQYEIEAKTKAQKALAAKKEQMARSAYPGFDKDYFQRLSGINNTDRVRNRGKANLSNLSIIHKMNQKHRAENPDQNMMNDNEGVAVKEKVETNDTTLTTKMKQIRKEGGGLAYERINKNLAVSSVPGVYCDFENPANSSGIDMCQWQWNTTVSSHGLGFQVMTPADVVQMNESTKGLEFSGPTTDADGHADGHFLYLPVDPTMENMVIKSPAFPGLKEFCKFEVYLHQSRMANASIRLISETTMNGVQLLLSEMAGNNHQVWQPMRFTIGKVVQQVRIVVEITRPRHVSLSQPLPHIALDDIRMLECLPEPPVRGGECPDTHIKCSILTKESCIKQQQVCDLVRDCDNGFDEHQNCDKMPYGSYCNFETDYCGFENVPQPILKWTRHNGPTPTDKTGPNYDHTCGPPGQTPAPVVPPQSPAHMNYSLGCKGYYMFVNMNVTGPNNEKADFASTAVMNTILFNPPPTVHGNISSSYYNCCMIRFYYQQNGRNYGSLSVDVVELTARGNMTTALWFSTKDKGENWYRAEIFLPNITRKYYLQFKTRMGMRIYSDSAIDDFSLSPECFGLNIPPEELGDYNYYEPDFEKTSEPHKDFKEATFYRFTTCGATGRFGPNQTMCDEAYAGTSVSVTVETQPPYQGIQAWVVPHEGMYTIIASGAGGGLGAAGSGVSHGATVRGVFELHRHELLYMLVGQQGTGACRKTLSASDSPDCTRPATDASHAYTSKTHEVRNTHVQDGGGGGGGATFVFVMDHTGGAVPLIVSGGGGGVSTGAFRDDGTHHARGLTNTTPESGYMYGRPGETAGAGGGWLARPGPVTPGHELVTGAALLRGGAGGRACHGGAHGGFGGGGGGCLRGGGGGGWRGGDTDQGSNGGGGYSYMDTTRAVPHLAAVTVAPHMTPGQVLIIPALHACGCDYRCVALNEFRSEVRCYCPATWNTDALDTTKCILDDDWPRISWFVIIVLSVVVFIFALAVLCICLYLYNIYQRKKESEIRRKRLLEQELQLRRLRNPPTGADGALTDFNPHYGSESFLPQGIDVRGLPQVSRESLKLVKALGQGAFGEVYQGLYRHRAGDTVEMPVAVKTLPELSTGQAESDFLMEAAIMAKFNHPNIVHLIGVCFDRHPRFIVLELLAGGDLKNFLRESRPRPERASALTMKDLLLCAVDVCKGCRYLELKRFIHRDIAARNCLLTSRGPGRVVKIADFGMARDIYRADYYKKGGKAMLPIKWMPPEAYIDGVFTIKTDVWSFGVLLWEVFSLGVMPYTGCANREVMEMVSGGGRLEKPYGCPLEIYRLMCECWIPAPADRPSFAHMFDRLSLFLADPEIVSQPLPILRSLLPPMSEHTIPNGLPRAPPCDYLVPLSPSVAPSPDSPTLVLHSKAPLGPSHPDSEDLQYQHLLKASQDYGNIAPRGGVASGSEAAAVCLADVQTKFQTSNSTDRLLSAAEEFSMDDDTPSEIDDRPIIWETSFTEQPDIVRTTQGPAVDKLISITPTSPKPPENALSLAMDSSVVDKTKQTPSQKTSLAPERKNAPIASPDPPRINAWKEPPKLTPKPKPFSLDAAQLEQNLNALKKNSGSVNLNTMNILPPYINVVTPNKLSESKTIQIDPKKAVIHDLQSPKEETVVEESKLKQSASSASLINGPMTDVPYADSDNASSSSGSNPPNHLQNIQKSKQNNYSDVTVGKSKVTKQGSNGLNDSEISC